jgi:hypothetical protein
MPPHADPLAGLAAEVPKNVIGKTLIILISEVVATSIVRQPGLVEPLPC